MELLGYLLKVSACTALFFAFYLVVLRRLTFFSSNRFYLLITLIISFVIPALQLTVEREVEEVVVIENQVPFESLETVSARITSPNAPQISANSMPVFNWENVLPYVYMAVSAVLLLIMAWRVVQLWRLTHGDFQKVNGLKLVNKVQGATNCSFFNYVFIDEQKLTAIELQILLRHEAVHAKNFHSVDKLLMMMIKAVLWFNPIIYLYDQALEQTHEYEADETASNAFGTNAYAKLLLRLAATAQQIPLVHNFVKSPVKERIKMLFNDKSKNMKKLSYLMAVPVGMALTWLFAIEVVNAQQPKVVQNKETVATKPFINRKKETLSDGKTRELVTVTANGQLVMNLISNSQVKPTLLFYINKRYYTEEEANQFSPAFIRALSKKSGVGNAHSQYVAPGYQADRDVYVVWFGTEAPLNERGQKSRNYAQKYNGTTIAGTVADFTYDKNQKKDGFMIKTSSGETLKAYIEAKFVDQIVNQLAKGDQLTVKIYNAQYWPPVEYPVLSSFKLSKGKELLMDRWPKTASNSTNAEQNDVAKLAKPRLLFSQRATIDNNTSTTYIQKGTMQIGDVKLEAEELTWDQKNQIITAKTATITDEKGAKVKHERVTYNAKTGVYNSSNKEIQSAAGAAAFDVFSKLKYTVQDSIRTSKVDGIMTLYGKVRLTIDNYVLAANVAEVNKKTNLITARGAVLTDPDGNTIKADLIRFNLLTKQYTDWKKND